MILTKLWQWITGEERIFIVTKTVRVRAYSKEEALNKAKALAQGHPMWLWDCTAETEDLF